MSGEYGFDANIKHIQATKVKNKLLRYKPALWDYVSNLLNCVYAFNSVSRALLKVRNTDLTASELPAGQSCPWQL